MFVNAELSQGFVGRCSYRHAGSLVLHSMAKEETLPAERDVGGSWSSAEQSSSSFSLSPSFPGSLRRVNVIGQAQMRKLLPLKMQCVLEHLGGGRM